jgi:hypothetical protein
LYYSLSHEGEKESRILAVKLKGKDQFGILGRRRKNVIQNDGEEVVWDGVYWVHFLTQTMKAVCSSELQNYMALFLRTLLFTRTYFGLQELITRKLTAE